MNNHPPLSPEDPRLTAFALGELEGAELAAVQAEVAASAALQQQVERIRADAATLRAQLQAAEPVGLSPAFLSRLNAALADQAAATEVDAAIADRILQKNTSGAAGQEAGSSVAASEAFPLSPTPATVPPGADWRSGLGRDARHRVVWWSPFALPFAACLVGLIAVGILWKEGYRGAPVAEAAVADAPLQLMSANAPARLAVVQAAKSEAYADMPDAELAAAASVQRSMPFEAALAAAPQQSSAKAFAAEGSPVHSRAVDGQGITGSIALLSKRTRTDLFAPRVWAYGHGGLAVRDSALVPSGLLPYAGEESLTVFETTVAEPSGADAEILVASDSGAPVSARSLPAGAGIGQEHFAHSAAPRAVAGLSRLAGSGVSDTTLQVARQRATSASEVADAEANSDVSAVRSAPPMPAVASAPSNVVPPASAVPPAGQGDTASVTEGTGGGESSSRVLAEAVALVRPVAVGEAGGEGAAAAAFVSDMGAVGSATAAVAATEVAVAAEPPVGEDAENAENAAIAATRLSASQIAALAAAKHFRQASLEELEAAAFTSGGHVWRAGGEEVTAAAAQVARAEQSASAGAQEAQAGRSGQMPPAVRPLNLASRYVQAKLWVEAGQLPPVADVDVDAIVRDAVPLYAPTALRRLRAQAGAKLLAESSAGASSDRAAALAAVPQATVAIPPSGSASGGDTAGGAVLALSDPAELTAQELTQLEAQSPLLRFVRAYATVLKDRPADAVAKLDAITAQVKARPRMAASRNGQEFLKLLEATRELF